MARGIISTILGGVAGGLEGRRVASVREREEMERERDRQDRLERERLTNLLTVQSMGGRLGTELRPDQAAIAQRTFEGTPVSRALDQAPLFDRPSEAPVSRSPLEAAFQARMPAPEFAERAPRAPQFTPMTEDEDYQQIALPGGQVASFLTPEARRRQERSDIEEERAYERSLVEDQRAYDDRVRQDSQFFQQQMAELNNNFSRETQIILSNLNKQNQIELLNARHAIESGLLQDPEQRYLSLQGSYANMLPRFIDENGDFNHAGAASVANIFGQFVGMTGPEFMNMVVGNLEAEESENLAPEGVRSILDTASQIETAGPTQIRRLEQEINALRQRAEATQNRAALRYLQSEIRRREGDLARARREPLPYRMQQLTPTSRQDYDY